MKKPPKKLSDLIILAMKDFDKVRKDPRYKIDMGEWHAPNGKCKVCLAGSVMAKSLKFPIEKEMVVWDNPQYFYKKDWADSLYQLDAIRLFNRLSSYFNNNQRDVIALFKDHDGYGTNMPKHWYESMQDLVGVLQAEGL